MLAINSGGGHFEAVNAASLVNEPYRGRFLVPVDADADGDLDLAGLSLEGDNIGDDFYTRGLALELYANSTISD